MTAVTPEAVTAARKAISCTCDGSLPHDVSCDKDISDAGLSAALEAAAPHIRAQVYAEIRQLATTSEAFYRGFCHQDTHCTHGGHIRPFADLIPGGDTGG